MSNRGLNDYKNLFNGHRKIKSRFIWLEIKHFAGFNLD